MQYFFFLLLRAPTSLRTALLLILSLFNNQIFHSSRTFYLNFDFFFLQIPHSVSFASITESLVPPEMLCLGECRTRLTPGTAPPRAKPSMWCGTRKSVQFSIYSTRKRPTQAAKLASPTLRKRWQGRTCLLRAQTSMVTRAFHDFHSRGSKSWEA